MIVLPNFKGIQYRLADNWFNIINVNDYNNKPINYSQNKIIKIKIKLMFQNLLILFLKDLKVLVIFRKKV